MLCIQNKNCQLTPVSLFFIIINIYHYWIVGKLRLLFICHCMLQCNMQKQDFHTHTIKLFFVYKRNDSVTRMLFEIGIPSFDTIMHNCLVTVSRCWHVCSECTAVVTIQSLVIFWIWSAIYSYKVTLQRALLYSVLLQDDCFILLYCSIASVCVCELVRFVLV